MRTVELGSVATIERKGVDPRAVAPETLYIGLEHIERGGRIIGHDTVARAELASTKFQFSPGHVLFGKLRPNLGKVSRPDFAGVCSTDILPIRPGKDLDRNYLAHYLAQPSMVDFAASRTSGANLPRLSPTVLATFPVPLPPLPEQRRIAAILDHADALRAKRRQVLTHIDALGSAAFVERFGSHAELLPLRESLTFVTSGGRGWAKYYSDEGDRFIQSLDVQMGSISARDPVFVVPPDNAEARRTRTAVGDVLLTITGSRIGRVAALPAALAGSFVSQHVAILRPDAQVMLPEFLAAMLALPSLGQHLIAGAQYGQTKPGLNFEQIRGFSLPRPPLPEQQQFVDHLERIARQRAAMTHAETSIAELFACLQSRAFRGEL